MKTISLFCILAVFTSCSGQNTPPLVDGLTDRHATMRIGDTVTALDKCIMTIFQDSKNLYWFGSKGQGVYRYDGKNILHFTKKHGLCSNDIWGIQEDKSGNIYFDTQDGVGKFDGRTFSTLKVTPTTDSEWKSEMDDLWFKGNWNVNGAYRFDGKDLHHLAFPKNELADELVKKFPNMTWSPYGLYSLYKDKKGTIWFGTSNVGIYRFDGKSVSRMYEKHLTDIEETGGSFGIRSILEDKEGKFWFSNTRYRYHILPVSSNKQGQNLVNYEREDGIDILNASDGMDRIYFLSAIEDHLGRMWMVTYNQGVWQYDGKKMTHFEVKDGSKDITLFTIYKDKQGDLWLGSHETGVYKFNGKTFEKFKP